jgi:hypothetical protein
MTQGDRSRSAFDDPLRLPVFMILLWHPLHHGPRPPRLPNPCHPSSGLSDENASLYHPPLVDHHMPPSLALRRQNCLSIVSYPQIIHLNLLQRCLIPSKDPFKTRPAPFDPSSLANSPSRWVNVDALPTTWNFLAFPRDPKLWEYPPGPRLWEGRPS